MNVYVYNNQSQTIAILMEEIINEQIVLCADYKEAQNNSLLLYAEDYFNEEFDREIADYCLKNNITLLRMNLLPNSAYIGPVSNNKTATLNKFLRRMKTNTPDHRLLLMKNNKNVPNRQTLHDVEFIRLCAKLCHNILHTYLNGDRSRVFNKMWIATQHPFNISEHKLFIDHPDGKKSDTFHEDELFNNKIKKVSPTIHRSKSEQDADKISKDIVDHHFGIAKHIHFAVDSRFIPMIGAESMMENYGENNAFGRSDNFVDARQSALLENLERYFNSSNRQGRTKVFASYNDLKDVAIHPSVFGLHEDHQLQHPAFKYVKYSDDLNIYWAWSWSLKYSKYVLIPEQMIYYTDEDDIAKNSRFIYESSNGAALGSTLEEALLYGIFEVIERDNFFVAFYNRLPLIEVDIEQSGLKQWIPILEYLKAEGYRLHFFDMSMELKIPSIWSVMINESEEAVVKTYSAAGTHFNPEQALESALIEVVTSVPVYENIFHSDFFVNRKEKIFNDTNELTEFADHVLYYSHEQAVENLNFILKNNAPKQSLQELYPTWYETETFKNDYLHEDIKCLLTDVLTYYDDVYVTNLTGDGLDNMNLACAKVLIPGMQPVTFGHQYMRLIKDRIKNGPVLANRTTTPIEERQINLDPHPFP